MAEVNIDEVGQSLTDTSLDQGPRQFGRFDDSAASDLSDIPGALLRRENTIGSAVLGSRFNREREAIEDTEGFNYFDNVPDDMFGFRDRFVSAGSEEEVSLIARKIRKEISDSEIVSSHPIASLAIGIPMSLIDPITLMPGGAVFKRADSAYGIGKSALLGVGALSAAGLASETALSPTQQVRSLEESAFNVMGSALFGGVTGGFGAALSGSAIARQVAKDNAAVLGGSSETLQSGPRSENLSAAKVDEAYLKESERFANLGGVLAKAPGFNPILRMSNSPFLASRQAVDALFSYNIVKKKNLPEFGNWARDASLETDIKKAQGAIGKTLMDYQSLYFKQRGIDDGPFKSARSKLSSEGMDFDTWDAQVSMAIIDGGKHQDPSVQAGAEHLMENVFNPLRDEAIKLGMLPENVSVSTANGYFTRVYNTQKIKENPEGFRGSVRPWFVKQNEELKSFQPLIREYEAKIAAAKAGLTRSKKKGDAAKIKSSKDNLKAIEKEFSEAIPKDLKDSKGRVREVLLDDEKIDNAVSQTLDNILGRNDNKLLNPVMQRYMTTGKTKPLQNRQFLIPDKLIRDWTLQSASRVSGIYSRGMIPVIEMAKLGDRLGIPAKNRIKIGKHLDKKLQLEDKLAKESPGSKKSIDLHRQISEIEESIELLESPASTSDVLGHFEEALRSELDAAKRGKTPKENAALEKAFESNKKDIQGGIETILGIYGAGPNTIGGSTSQALSNFRKWNVARLMGFVTLSSIPDVGNMVVRNGPMAVIYDGLKPILGSSIASIKNKELLQDLGFVTNKANGQRAKSFLDHEGTDYATGPITKTLDSLSQSTLNLSGMNAWQDTVQFMAGNISISRTLRTIDKWARTGQMSRDDRIRLNALGLGEEHWRTVHQQWKKTGGKENGAYYAEYGDWDLDSPEVSEAYRLFTSSIYDDVVSTIIEPGAGDLPLFSRTETGRMLMQFKSFQIATHNKLLVSGLSRNDANFYMGVVSMLSLGAIGYAATSKLKFPTEELDLSIGKLTQEGIDRSGLMGVLMETYNMGQKMVGANGVSRYQSRGVLGAWTGPTIGAGEDMSYIINKASRSIQGEAEFTTKDAEKVMRLFPYQNLFYIHYLNRQLTKKVATSLGARES